MDKQFDNGTDRHHGQRTINNTLHRPVIYRIFHPKKWRISIGHARNQNWNWYKLTIFKVKRVNSCCVFLIISYNLFPGEIYSNSIFFRWLAHAQVIIVCNRCVVLVAGQTRMGNFVCRAETWLSQSLSRVSRKKKKKEKSETGSEINGRRCEKRTQKPGPSVPRRVLHDGWPSFPLLLRERG